MPGVFEGLEVSRNCSQMMNHSWLESQALGVAVYSAHALLFLSALVSNNHVYRGSAQVLFMARWIAFPHLLSRTLQVLIHHPL